MEETSLLNFSSHQIKFKFREKISLLIMKIKPLILSMNEYLEIEERKELLKTVQVLKKWNDRSFCPNQGGAFTEDFNG